jgi:hypothetical protein
MLADFVACGSIVDEKQAETDPIDDCPGDLVVAVSIDDFVASGSDADERSLGTDPIDENPVDGDSVLDVSVVDSVVVLSSVKMKIMIV